MPCFIPKGCIPPDYARWKIYGTGIWNTDPGAGLNRSEKEAEVTC